MSCYQRGQPYYTIIPLDKIQDLTLENKKKKNKKKKDLSPNRFLVCNLHYEEESKSFDDS